eukprot:91542-Pelagomonas_calceolata.AAC.2
MADVDSVLLHCQLRDLILHLGCGSRAFTHQSEAVLIDHTFWCMMAYIEEDALVHKACRD